MAICCLKFLIIFLSFWLLKKTVDYRNCTLFQHDFSTFVESSFINDFTRLSWDFLNETNLNINSKFDTFYEKVHETAIKHVPLEKVAPKQLKLKSKPWIDSHVQKLIKHRDRLLRKLRKTHSNTTEEIYKKFRNRVASENRKSKIKYFDDYFQSNKSNMKNLWSGIKCIINTISKNAVQNNSQVVVNGKTHQDPQEMANVFNNFFINASNQVCSGIPRTRKPPLDYLKERNPHSFYMKPIIHAEIEDIISSFKISKSTGSFNVPAKFLKLLKPYISRPLAIIFNESIIAFGIFPDKLKYVKVIPIHRTGSPTDPSNYRPISLISIYSKILEKLMFIRIS